VDFFLDPKAITGYPFTTMPIKTLRGLLIAQFCGAFNDNAWKLMVALLTIRTIRADVSPSDFEAATQGHTTLVFVIFTLPLMLVSLVAGTLADRFSKRTIIIAMKAAEVLLMAVATTVLFLNPAGGVLALVVLGCMGAHSALFSPAKYGILPEILSHERLAAGNGLLEMSTFVAIIAGTYAGGILLGASGSHAWTAGLILTAFATVGFFASWSIPKVFPARTQGGVLATLKDSWTAMRGDRVLGLAIIGSIAFWTIASLFSQDIVVYAKSSLGLSDALSGLPLAVLAAGIGVGGFLAGKLSASKVEYGFIPLGAIGLAAFMLLLGVWSPSLTGTLGCIFLLGVSGGLIVVPINSLIQWRAPEDRRGGVISLTNVFVFGGVLLGSLSDGALSRLGLSSADIFIATGVAAAGGTAWALWLLPQALVRLILVLLTMTFYRLTILGRAHVPGKGGVLLVPNHVSFIDGLLLIAGLDRPVRFIVEAEYFHHPLLKPLMKAMGAIPIAADGGPRVVLHALKEAGRYLDAGEIVCIFPEGQLTRTGMMQPFRRGFERIVKGRHVPIVPVYLDRVWGSIFSYAGGRFLTKLPERIPYSITVAFGDPLPVETSVQDVRTAVHELSERTWMLRKDHRRPLHHTCVRAFRRHPFRLAMADATRPQVSCLQALTGAIALARALRAHWRRDELRVGILLPPSVGGALVNLAAALSGRTSVNLNYTAGQAGMESAAKQAGLRSLVTSRLFVEKASLILPTGIEPIWLDELGVTISTASKLYAFVLAVLAPIRLLQRGCGAARTPSMDDIVTIIFSSGSTGEPKGVLLSHFNIDSNVEAVAQVFGIQPDDRLLGILPFFHSFGYMATLWLAVNHGMGVVYHPSPLDAVPIGTLTKRYRVTFLVATPTFLQLYLRRCTPEQFGSLRAVLTGAEKLPERLALAFEDKFGIRPLEGYGVTEAAPVIAVNVPGFRAPGFNQSGARRGHVGHPLPGVVVRVVDPDTWEPRPIGTAGMLLVKGPNVMRGYLGRDDLTANATRDGWYITGDIGIIDEDGFIQITDRLSRFSKIGGEMVPHGRVEQALQEAAGADLQVFAVTGVPDERKGERLAVLHTVDEASLPAIVEKIATGGLPNLFVPRRDQFIKVDKLPVLGTGKLDLREVKRVAIERLAAST